MNKKLLASLLRSRSDSSKLLAMVLADYNPYLLQEILSDLALNPKDEDFVNFGYNRDKMNIHQNNHPGVLWVTIPKRRRVGLTLFSWNDDYKTHSYDKS